MRNIATVTPVADIYNFGSFRILILLRHRKMPMLETRQKLKKRGLARTLLVVCRTENPTLMQCYTLLRNTKKNVTPAKTHILFWVPRNCPAPEVDHNDDFLIQPMKPTVQDRNRDAEPEGTTEKKRENNNDQTARASRRLLATAETIPSYLRDMFDVPTNVSIAHTTHVDTTLPLFQARLAAGSYKGKCLFLISEYCFVNILCKFLN